MGHTPCDVSSWINAAIRRSAQTIEVNVQPSVLFCPLPKDLFTSQVLVDLRLCRGFVFDVPVSVSLPSLKTIHLSSCNFSNGDSTKRLFSSCPVLEELSLVLCDTSDGNVISISVLSLKHLSIYSGERSGCPWKLNNVPNLKTLNLSIHDSNTTKCCSVDILKSLRKASINVCGGEDYDMIWKLVNKFEEVQSLSLSGDWMEGFILTPDVKKLSILKLEVNFSRGWKFFPILLGRSPCLEHLNIDGAGFSNCDEEFLEIDTLLPKRIPMCFSRSLRTVQIRMFKEKKVDYGWLGYLLKKAKVLELLILVVSFVDEGEEDSAYLEEEFEIKKKLIALPRGSKDCQIVIAVIKK